MSGVKVRHDQQVDVGRLAAGRLQATDGRLRAQVARRLVRQREPSFVDARAIDDPVRVESVRFAQVLIAHDLLGDIASRAEDLHAQERAGRRREMDLAVVHEQDAADIIRDRRMPRLLSHSARDIISSGDLLENRRPGVGSAGSGRMVNEANDCGTTLNCSKETPTIMSQTSEEPYQSRDES